MLFMLVSYRNELEKEKKKLSSVALAQSSNIWSFSSRSTISFDSIFGQIFRSSLEIFGLIAVVPSNLLEIKYHVRVIVA